jgi:hypothetical protein
MARIKKQAPKLAAYVTAKTTGKPLSICPVCWSRPSVSKRRQLQASSRTKSWNFSVKDIKTGRRFTTATVAKYPCTNCDTVIIVRSPLQDTGEAAPWVKETLLSKGDTETYYEHPTTKDGLWTGYVPPPPVNVSVERADPWLLVRAEALESEFPKHWTRDGNAIKVRVGTDQQHKIWTWFAKRGHPLEQIQSSKKKKKVARKKPSKRT